MLGFVRSTAFLLALRVGARVAMLSGYTRYQAYGATEAWYTLAPLYLWWWGLIVDSYDLARRTDQMNQILLAEALRWALDNGAHWDPVIREFIVVVSEESSSTRPIEPPAHLLATLTAVVNEASLIDRLW